jgi:hypothetical protein
LKIQLANSPVSVVWTVDGITQNQQNSENLVIGQNRIIRTAADPAGNIGADTVTVYLDESCITISNTTLTICCNDQTYDNRSLCINNSIVNILGYHSFKDITLNRSTVVADTGFTVRDLLLTVSSTLTQPATVFAAGPMEGGVVTHRMCPYRCMEWLFHRICRAVVVALEKFYKLLWE